MEILTVPLDALVPDPNNARAHPKENIDAIKASLTRFGQVLPILVRENDCQVVAGNGTLEAMQELGWTECKAALYSGDDNECKALAIALNRTGELATWNEETLGATLQELKGQGFDLECLGFDSRGLDAACAGFRHVEFDVPEGNKIIDEEAMKDTTNACPKCGFVW